MQEGQAILPVGAVILGHYIVENVLSKGSSGAIYLVTDQHLKNATSNSFTLKEVIDSHKQERHQLIFDGVLLMQLHHYALPHIYRAFNNEEHGRAYVVMEYVAGPNLETLRQQQPRQRFSLPDIMSLMAPIIDAVSYLHHQQPPIIHRDIKPTNIIVPNAEEARTVLVDFGTMKHFDSRMGVINHAHTIRPCSPGYRAPEYNDGSFDTRTDVYGLGATFYTLVTGIMPPDGFSRLTQVGNEEVDPLKPVHKVLPTVPTPVAEAIDRAMSLDVHQRFWSVEQFCEALCELTNAPPIPVSQPAPVLSSMPSTSSPPVPPTPTSPSTDWDRSSMPPTSSPPPVPPLGERAIEPATVTTIQRMPRVERPGFSFTRKLVVLLAVFVLLIGLGVSTGFGVRTLSYATTLEELTHHLAPLAPTFTSSTSTPMPVSPPTSTSGPTVYPTLAGTYAGTIYDLTVNVKTSLLLTNIRQNQGEISGDLLIGSKLRGSGPFSGTIETTKHLQFTVTDAAGQPTLFFEGAIQSATSLSGDYYWCGPGPENPCPRAPGGYGVWSAVSAPFGIIHNQGPMILARA